MLIKGGVFKKHNLISHILTTTRILVTKYWQKQSRYIMTVSGIIAIIHYRKGKMKSIESFYTDLGQLPYIVEQK